MVTAVQSNPVPTGGTTATQPVAPPLTPLQIEQVIEQLQGPIVAFRQRSSPLKVFLPDMNPVLGVPSQVQISNVGLGYWLVSHHTVAFNVTNTSGGTVTTNFSPWFPFDLIQQIIVAINGGATVWNTSGRGAHVANWRSRRGGEGNLSYAQNVGLAPSVTRFSTLGTGITLNAATYSSGGVMPLSGQASFAITTGNTNSQLVVQFFTFCKLALSKNSLLGALPLQNNQTFASYSIQPVGALLPSSGSNNTFPFSGPAAVANFSIGLNTWNIHNSYYFWSVPPDPRLYADMVTNSYQVIENPNLTAGATGVSAIDFKLPANNYLAALHLWGIDNQATPTWLVPLTAYQNLRVVYNAGSVIPVAEAIPRKMAEQVYDYGSDLSMMPGYLLWDGNDTSDDVNFSDQAGWIDCYQAANPEIQVDLASTVTTPVTYSILREYIVAGAVNVVGG